MNVLGLEGTAHTLGASVIDGDFEVLSDIRKTYSPPKGGGIHPRDSSQYMSQMMPEAVACALSDARLTMDDIGLVSFSQGPGLGPCLRTIGTAARMLSLYNKKPVMGVNHCVAHIEVGKVLSGFEDPLVLYVSGANTQVIKLLDGRYRVFGETRDVGLGNMLDKFGRLTGLVHPAGPKIEELAKNGSELLELPYVVKGTDMSFSGILTSALRKHGEGFDLSDICFSLQETSFAMLCEVCERALAHLGAKQVLLAGGVGCNKRLQSMCAELSREHGAEFDFPAPYMGDNGAMIAVLGLKMHNAGVRMDISQTSVDPQQRTDSIDIIW